MTAHAKIIVLLISSLSLLSCSHKTIYTEYHSMPANGWHMDSLQVFSWEITDTAATYDIILHIRHSERYRYQNMWLFIDNELTETAVKDTIEFYLADDRGYWLGNNHSGFIEMPVIYEQGYTFDSIGRYSLRLQQGMRDSVLGAILDVGVEIQKQ